MASNKLEKQFRETINTRVIKPSPQAWDRLDAMLSLNEKQLIKENQPEKRKKLIWFSVAAILIGFVIVNAVFFNTNEVQKSVIENQNSVVNNNKIENLNSKKQQADDKIIIGNKGLKKSKNIKNKNQSSVNNIAVVVNAKTNNNHDIKSRVSIIKNNQNQVVVINKSKNELVTNEIKKQDLISIQNENIVNQKTVSNDQKENNLLINIGTITTIQVDASTLLQQVDKEITNEYRETVFQKIGKNFQAVRVAIAERNIKK